MSDDSRIISITDAAYDKVHGIVQESSEDGQELALVIAIAGLNGDEFGYEMHMTPVDENIEIYHYLHYLPERSH